MTKNVNWPSKVVLGIVIDEFAKKGRIYNDKVALFEKVSFLASLGPQIGL